MICGSDDTMRVWINGNKVHDVNEPRSANPDSDRVVVGMAKGWNQVLIRVDNGVVDHGLYLRFEGEGLRLAVRKSEKEGS